MPKPLPILVMLLLAAIPGATPAQNVPAREAVLPTHDHCLLKDGKMMIIRGSEVLPLTETTTMRDGTICRTGGSCTRKDGTVIQMKEGEHMMKNGKIMKNLFVPKRPA